MVLWFKDRTELTEDMLYEMPKRLSLFLGIWSSYPWWKIFVLTSITVVTIMFANYTQWFFIIDHVKYWRKEPNWLEMVDVLATTMVLSVALFKILILASRKIELKKILDFLRDTMMNPDAHQKSKNMKLFRCKMAYYMNHLLIGGGFSTVTFYISIPIIINIFRVTHGLKIIRKLALPVQYPFRTDQSPGYEVAYIYSSYIAYIVVMMFSAADGLFISLCLYASAQFHHLEVEITNCMVEMGDSLSSDKFNLSENKVLKQKLRKIIIDHNDIIEVTEKMVNLFVPVILSHFFSSALMICFASIALIMAPGVQAVIFVGFVSVLLVQLYVYCAGGTFLFENSTKVGEAAYFTDWYKCDVETQKMILLIILRAQQGTKVEVPFFEASAPTFLNIISTAGSYITLLKTFL